MGSPSFTKKTLEQNGKKIYCYQSEDGQIELHILAASALISDLKIKGHSIISGPKTDEEIANNSLFKSSYLLPFPNRLKGGKFEHEDQSFQFEINDESGQNALHGIHVDSPFIMIDESARGALRLCFEQSYEGDAACFPFPYKFTVIINLDQHKCELNLQVQNSGQKSMPIGLGWHPFFTLQDPINDCSLCIPKCKKIEVDERLLPTGKKSQFDDFSKPKPIGEEDFDSTFLFVKDADFTSVTLENDEYKLRYYQETRDQKFNYLQVYTPEDRKSIAFEPMSCNVDAFNNKDGLRVLAPGKKFKARCGVVLTAK